MSAFCAECRGSGERDMQGFLDCAAPGCNAAVERAALDAHLLALGRLHERDLVWEAYKLGQAKAQGGWISVGDRLPDHDEEGISYVWAAHIGAPHFPRPVSAGEARYHKTLGWQPAGCQGWDWIVTHWMPLPAAPANNNTEKAE